MGYRFVVAEPNNSVHRDAVLGLWQRNFRLINSYDCYEWLYAANPAGQTITVLAILEDQDRIIGCASIMRRDFVLEGDVYHGGVAILFSVDPEFRVFGPALQLQRVTVEQAWKQGLEFIVGFPNRSAWNITRRVGYERMGKKARFTHIVRSNNKLREKLPNIFPNWLINSGSYVLDAGLLLRNRIAGGASSRTELVIGGELARDWQELWKKISANPDFKGDLGEGYVQWRYLCCPYRDYRISQLFDPQGKLLAYLIFSSKENLVLIEEFRFSDQRWMHELFAKFWREMRSQGVEAINAGLVFNGKIIDLMLKAGYLPRPMDRDGVIFISKNTSVDWEMVLQERDWYIPDGELDL